MYGDIREKEEGRYKNLMVKPMRIKLFFILIILIFMIEAGFGQNELSGRNDTSNQSYSESILNGSRIELLGEQKYQDAKDAYNNKEYHEALDAFNKFLVSKPNNVSAWFYKGLILDKIEKYPGALEAYDKALRLSNSSSTRRDLWYNKGTILEKIKNYDAAIDAYDRSIEDDNENKSKDAYYNKGNILYKTSNYDEAVLAYSGAIKLDPNYKNATFNQGNAFYMQNMYKEAAESYIRASRLINASDHNDKDKYIWNNRGAAQRNLGNFGDALFSFSSAIKIDKNYTNSLYSKALVLAELGRYNESIEFFNRTTEIDPNNTEAFSGKGLAMLSLGRYEEAIESYKKATEANESYEAAWRGMGIALEKTNKDVDALISFKRALNLSGENSSENLYLMGIVLYKLNSHSEALKSYKKAREIQLQAYGLDHFYFFILFILVILGSLILMVDYSKIGAILHTVFLLNLNGMVAFFLILLSFLKNDLLLQFIIINITIILISAFLVAIVDSRTGTYTLKIKLASSDVVDEHPYLFSKYLHYLLSLIYLILIFLPPRITDNLAYQIIYPMIFIIITELILTFLLVFFMMKSVAIDKDTTNVIFISYIGYLGLNALMIYWILWASGEVGRLNGLYGYLIENPYIIVISSIILIFLCLPFIYVSSRTDALRQGIIKKQNDWLDVMTSSLDTKIKLQKLQKFTEAIKELNQIKKLCLNEIETCFVSTDTKHALWQLDPKLEESKFRDEIQTWINEELPSANNDICAVLESDRFKQKLLNQKKELASLETQSKDTKIRSWASFVNIFSLFLGPALSSLATNAGLSIGSEAFSELVSNVMGSIL